MLQFDRFRFDRANQRVEDASGAIRLNPKAFDVLRVLIERPGQLVSKEQLLDAVWPDTHVADGVLKVCMAEIRKALGDSATAPRFIETVHRSQRMPEVRVILGRFGSNLNGTRQPFHRIRRALRLDREHGQQIERVRIVRIAGQSLPKGRLRIRESSGAMVGDCLLDQMLNRDGNHVCLARRAILKLQVTLSMWRVTHTIPATS